ncbi:succinate dehydrogenase cytochrome b560 subunit [Mycena metata]|uniref:Succinate dehydrogenase cytochrome b560 subunit n=1 Tax=Mycena metata TaxID=1033252 RepID=A0AAD7NW24_9AGAR|nr:succinate dehydrogenase cytochrome b560 subunit [Mycena metata]
MELECGIFYLTIGIPNDRNSNPRVFPILSVLFLEPPSRNVYRSYCSSRAAARRAVHIQSFPPSSAPEILNKQRLLRPTSPHLTIYQPQVTSILSIGNRFTGAALSALLYGFSLAYLFAPTAFNSVHVVDFVTGLPDAAKYAGKFILAAPFAFHSLNGVRHLAWDMGKFATIPGVYQTGYAVMIGTVISTVALVLS